MKKLIKDIDDNNTETLTSGEGLLNKQDFITPQTIGHANYSRIAMFQPVLRKEIEKINIFVTSKVKELENRILQLLRTPQKENSLNFIKELKTEADDISAELSCLNKFIILNYTAIRKIIKKFDKNATNKITPWINVQVEDEAFLQVKLDSLLVALSDVYQRINEFKKNFEALEANAETSKGISASTFERKTTKYWVKSTRIMDVKLSIIKHLPAYLFDRKSGKIGERPMDFLKDFGEIYSDISDSHAISSIYLDNNTMDIYRTRLLREEGAQLFRIRWYGDSKSLSKSDQIFFERKTHHESWVMAKSVKERFPIKAKNIEGFLNGTFDPASKMDKWRSKAKILKNDVEVQKSLLLAQESQKSVLELQLRPCVRTLYNRTAFQANESNDVRISIDTQLTMVNENVPQNENSVFNWCRNMNESLPSSDVLQFPYCVLEVKLNCETEPEWIKTMLWENDVVEVQKFSKFLTGASYFNYEKIEELPYWFKMCPIIDPRFRYLPNEEKEKLKISIDFGNDYNADSTMDSISNCSKSSKAKKSMEPVLAPSKIEKLKAKEEEIKDEESGTEEFDEKQPLIQSHSDNTMSKTGSRLSIIDHAMAFFKKPRDNNAGRPMLRPTQSSARIKIEPKTSFANERTLMNWVTSATLIMTLATMIMTDGSDFGYKTGVVFFPLSFVIMIYAVLRYQYRAWAFRHNRAQNHDDLIGPVILVICICAIGSVILYLMSYYNAPVPYMVPHNAPPRCSEVFGQHDEPNSPIVDVLASDNNIFSVSPFWISQKSKSHNSSWSHISYPNKNLASISFVEGRIFLGENGPTKEILEFVTLDNKIVPFLSLKNVDDLYLKMFGAHLNLGSIAFVGSSDPVCPFSHAFVADTSNSLIKLHIDCGSEFSIVDVIPFQNFGADIPDMPVFKHISSMYFQKHSNTLFILFGKFRELRAFDIKNGKLAKRWKLPGSSENWTGFSFNEEHLYLSQAFPHSVWKFQWSLQNNIIQGSFPHCANVLEEDLTLRYKNNVKGRLKKSITNDF